MCQADGRPRPALACCLCWRPRRPVRSIVGGQAVCEGPPVMVRDPFFDEVIGAASCEPAEECDGVPVGVVDEIDAWFADASRGDDVSVLPSETESGRELIGAAALGPRSRPVHQGGQRRPAARTGSGRRRSRRLEQGHGSRVRPVGLACMAIASLLAMVVVILPARPPAPDQAVHPGITSRLGASRPTSSRADEQRRERADARRASRTLAHRRTVARERRAETRRADRRSAVRRQRAARVHTPSNAPTLTVTNPHTERPHPRLSPVQPEKRKPPAATGEFEP